MSLPAQASRRLTSMATGAAAAGGARLRSLERPELDSAQAEIFDRVMSSALPPPPPACLRPGSVATAHPGRRGAVQRGRGCRAWAAARCQARVANAGAVVLLHTLNLTTLSHFSRRSNMDGETVPAFLTAPGMPRPVEFDAVLPGHRVADGADGGGVQADRDLQGAPQPDRARDMHGAPAPHPPTQSHQHKAPPPPPSPLPPPPPHTHRASNRSSNLLPVLAGTGHETGHMPATTNRVLLRAGGGAQVGAEWASQFEWFAHAPLAEKHGAPPRADHWHTTRHRPQPLPQATGASRAHHLRAITATAVTRHCHHCRSTKTGPAVHPCRGVGGASGRGAGAAACRGGAGRPEPAGLGGRGQWGRLPVAAVLRACLCRVPVSTVPFCRVPLCSAFLQCLSLQCLRFCSASCLFTVFRAFLPVCFHHLEDSAFPQRFHWLCLLPGAHCFHRLSGRAFHCGLSRLRVRCVRPHLPESALRSSPSA